MCVNGQVYCDQNGDGIYNGNDITCEIANCGSGDIDCACNATYSVGDRVLLVNDWAVGNGPSEGMLGTVLCGD